MIPSLFDFINCLKCFLSSFLFALTFFSIYANEVSSWTTFVLDIQLTPFDFGLAGFLERRYPVGLAFSWERAIFARLKPYCRAKRQN